MNQHSAKSNPIIDASTADGPAGRIAFVQSRWHKEIVDRCRDAFLAKIVDLGIPRKAVETYEVPGAFEIPLQAKLLARSGRYAAIVASGLIVDGGIYRHEFVAQAVIGALMSLQLETDVPVISAVLTPQSFHDHDVHRRFFADHFLLKGEEAAIACAGTMENIARLRRSAA
jgi:6,7-dimethyl-8-ribityllumazine synthase